MRIEYYQFRHKFRYLTKWCQPNTKYILTEDAFDTYNHTIISHGYSALNYNARKHLWLKFKNGHICGRYLPIGIPLQNITSPYILASYLNGLTRERTVGIFIDLMLNVNNLEKAG